MADLPPKPDNSAVRSSNGNKNVNPVVQPEPTVGRLAVPVSKISYTNIPEELKKKYTAPGGPEPLDNPQTIYSFHFTQGTSNFTTYDVYTFKVYTFSRYKEYNDASDEERNRNELKDQNQNAQTFELSFDVQYWQANGNSPTGVALNPTILQDSAREVAIYGIPGNIGVGRPTRQFKFAIQLFTLDTTTDRFVYEKVHDNQTNTDYKDAAFRYGQIVDGCPYGCNKGGVFVHNFGPRGSWGCATSPLMEYNQDSLLIAFETFMAPLMSLEQCKDKWVKDPKDKLVYPIYTTARIVLPGTSNPYPTTKYD